MANAIVQNDPDQVTEAMRNGPDGFVVSETWCETTIDDLEDTAFVFDGSIGSLIENAAHLTVTLRRAFAAVHAGALFFSRARSHPGDQMIPELESNNLNPACSELKFPIGDASIGCTRGSFSLECTL